jgi:hypothetical protein
MFLYKIHVNSQGQEDSVFRSDGWNIPFAVANTDYAQFKLELAEGVTLLDAEGVEMTPEQVQALLETLP